MNFKNKNREERLAHRKAQDRSRLDSAVEELVSVLKGGKKPGCLMDESAPPLIKAATMTAEATGINFEYPAEKITADVRLDDLARCGGFRYRHVILKGNWWTKDSGPLLAFLEDGNKPVALLPLSRRSYELVHPDSGERVKGI